MEIERNRDREFITYIIKYINVEHRHQSLTSGFTANDRFHTIFHENINESIPSSSL